MQEVVNATLLEKVKASIERNKSLQMLDICIGRNSLVDAVLKGARGNTSLKQLIIQLSRDQLKAAAELQQVRPQLELVNVVD